MVIKFIVFVLVISSFGFSSDVSLEMFTINNLWILISAFLVFMMHLGFATLESGLTRSKNTVNILFKNVSIIAIGLLTYALCGFNLMYPGEFNGFFGFAGFGLENPSGDMIDYASGSYTYYTDFIFQAMFAATAATIVSGAVAERVKLSSFLIFSTIYVAFLYPVLGSWKWGGGWLDQLGFYDFAGSTIVHSVGGWAALIGAYLIGPRIGKYTNSGIKPIMGHNMPLVCIGVFLLWFGWYGFNGGSVLSADPILVSYVFVTTTLSAAGGIIGSMLISWSITKKPDLSMVLNGSLAGLVGITAGADVISPFSAIIVGFISGLLVYIFVVFFDKLKIDDPVGAISVHLICGVWGTLAVGIFSSEHSFIIQLLGVFAYGLASILFSFILFSLIKYFIGLRVHEDEEIIGLDISEHEMESYAGFQIFTIE
ncbi:MAG: ammonium transporter [Candidatus Marinimicrobia bacterium]|nr:ammonium transporter [Candidatus Neomarinimicrobiota bacterium]|tara:strand:+ start:1132 stop:2409 length:1278 start_codon:yes stop_codon:yes gene_type:complete